MSPCWLRMPLRCFCASRPGPGAAAGTPLPARRQPAPASAIRRRHWRPGQRASCQSPKYRSRTPHLRSARSAAQVHAWECQLRYPVAARRRPGGATPVDTDHKTFLDTRGSQLSISLLLCYHNSHRRSAPTPLTARAPKPPANSAPTTSSAIATAARRTPQPPSPASPAPCPTSSAHPPNSGPKAP